MRSLAMLTVEKPPPSPLVLHSRGGPSAGQLCKRPVSVETPSRFGPRNCGQSSATSGEVTKAISAMLAASRRYGIEETPGTEEGTGGAAGGSTLRYYPRPSRVSREKRIAILGVDHTA